jgi:CSLREA domain-containing protein
MNNTSIKSTRTILLLCLLVGLLAFPSSAEASTFVVNTVDDLDDGSCDADHCSLREAIDAANANPGTDTIAFDIPGAGPHVIELCTLLPKLTDGGTIIDATTEPDYAGTPVVTLTPSADPSCAAVHRGIWILSDGNVIRGLHTIGFMQPTIQHEAAIFIETGSDNLIDYNHIGYEPSCPIINTQYGVKIEPGAGSQRIIKNVFNCNGTAIDVWGGGQLIRDNLIGVDPSGTMGIQNGNGIFVFELAHGNTIQNNVVSGNITAMIVYSDNNTIQGNRVGTDWSTNFAIPNQGGITVNGDNNRIGGTNPGEGNIIANNTSIGLDLYCGAEDNLVYGNIIGTNLGGSAVMGNRNGLTIMGSMNTIGGLSPGQANRILFSQEANVSLFAVAHKNIIQGNEIAYGRKQGILGTSSMGFPYSNTFSQNSIHHHRSIGIDLEPAGVTLNDPGDTDVGPNTLLNFPDLQSASVHTAEGEACPLCTVEIFIADAGKGAFGEGMTFVGSGNADASGHFSISLSGVSYCDSLTATATDGAANTSEFAKNILASCLTLVFPWPLLSLLAVIFAGALGNGLRGRTKGTPGRFAAAGGAAGVVLGIGLLTLGSVLPNIHLELLPQSAEEEQSRPLCSEFLLPDGYAPPAGAVFDTSEDPLLSWTPLSSPGEENHSWQIELLTPDGTTLNQTTQETSLAFSSFGYPPQPGWTFRWRITALPAGPTGAPADEICAPTSWMPFSFEEPEEEETPENTPTPTPTSTPTPTPTAEISACVYTASVNSNCRSSDYAESDYVDELLVGETAELIALNPEFTHGLFKLDNGQCWIWLGLLDGPDNPFGDCDVAIIDPPQACTEDLDEEACIASGGVWSQGFTDRLYCICP